MVHATPSRHRTYMALSVARSHGPLPDSSNPGTGAAMLAPSSEHPAAGIHRFQWPRSLPSRIRKRTISNANFRDRFHCRPSIDSSSRPISRRRRRRPSARTRNLRRGWCESRHPACIRVCRGGSSGDRRAAAGVAEPARAMQRTCSKRCASRPSGRAWRARPSWRLASLRLSFWMSFAEKEIDLAVLGTNALHGFERLVFGSTAEAVLRKSPCPVLTVGPRVGNCAKAPAAGRADYLRHRLRFHHDPRHSLCGVLRQSEGVAAALPARAAAHAGSRLAERDRSCDHVRGAAATRGGERRGDRIRLRARPPSAARSRTRWSSTLASIRRR